MSPHPDYIQTSPISLVGSSDVKRHIWLFLMAFTEGWRLVGVRLSLKLAYYNMEDGPSFLKRLCEISSSDLVPLALGSSCAISITPPSKFPGWFILTGAQFTPLEITQWSLEFCVKVGLSPHHSTESEDILKFDLPSTGSMFSESDRSYYLEEPLTLS